MSREKILSDLQMVLTAALASCEADRSSMFASGKVEYRPVEDDYVLCFYTEAGVNDGIVRLSPNPQTAAVALYWFVTGKEPEWIGLAGDLQNGLNP